MEKRRQTDQERYFFRQYPSGHVTEEMKEMPYSHLLEYCAQLYRRLDRIIAIMERQKTDKEVAHTVDSIMKAFERQATTKFDTRCLGYDIEADEEAGNESRD